VNSSQELIAEMPANPGKLSYASNGIGATSHLAGANLLRPTGCKAEHVPYRSGAEAIQALVKATCSGPSTCPCCMVRIIATATSASSWRRRIGSR